MNDTTCNAPSKEAPSEAVQAQFNETGTMPAEEAKKPVEAQPEAPKATVDTVQA